MPEDGQPYELHSGVVIEMQPTGPHELVGAFLVDYRALGAGRYIGKPKQPTITVCQLVEGEYQMQRLVSGQRLESAIFPDLRLTIDKIFQAAAV